MQRLKPLLIRFIWKAIYIASMQRLKPLLIRYIWKAIYIASMQRLKPLLIRNINCYWWRLKPPPIFYYFAYSMIRVSRMTVTFTMPGYFSSDSILVATSRAMPSAFSSLTMELSTMTRSSRPACMA